MGAAETDPPLKGLRTSRLAGTPECAGSRADRVAARRRRADLDGSDPFVLEPLDAGRSCGGGPRVGEEALSKHRLACERPPSTEGRHDPGDLRGREAGAVRESLAEPEKSPHRGGGTQTLPAARSIGDPLEGGTIPEHRRRRHRASDDPDKDPRGEGPVDDVTERRNSCSGSDLEPPAEDRGHTSETSAPEQVRKMCHLDRLGPGPGRQRTHRERGRECPRGTRPESLPDGEVVRKTHR